MVRYLITLFGQDVFDPSCEEPERFMYMPTEPAEGQFYWDVLDGSPLGVDALLLEIGLPNQEDPSPADEVPPSSRAVPAHVVQREIAIALERLDRLCDLPRGVKFDWPGVEDGVGWDLGVLLAAERLVQAGNSGSSYTLEDAEVDFFAHLPPAEDNYDPRHKWTDAVKHEGSTPLAYDAADDFGQWRRPTLPTPSVERWSGRPIGCHP